MGLYVGPCGIGEVGLVCSYHARYSSELPSPDTFSDGFRRGILRSSHDPHPLFELVLKLARHTAPFRGSAIVPNIILRSPWRSQGSTRRCIGDGILFG